MRTARLDPPPCPETTSHEELLCPACGDVVEVDWRDWADSTSGPVEIVRIRCANRHWFMMLAEGLRTRTNR
jgi:hypothetical protein